MPSCHSCACYEANDPFTALDLSEDLIQQAEERLEELGFSVHSHTDSGLVLAQPPQPADQDRDRDRDHGRTVTVLVPSTALGSAWAGELRGCFGQHDCRVDVAHEMPSQGEPGGGVVICLLDLQAPAFHDLDESTFRPFMDGLCGFRGRLVWVTPSASARCRDPRPAMAHGALRTAHMECGLDVTIVEVDRQSTPAPALAEALWRIWRGLPSRRGGGGALDPDRDYAVADGVVRIPRMQWFGLHDAEAAREATSSSSSSSSETTRCGRQGGTVLAQARARDGRGDEPPPGSSSLFRGDATYLLVGGTGGIGRSVSVWMAEGGARSFIFLSRSAEDPKNAPFIRELMSYPSCRVQAVTGDVSILADVQRAIALAPEDSPVAGIMQLSLVLCVSPPHESMTPSVPASSSSSSSSSGTQPKETCPPPPSPFSLFQIRAIIHLTNTYDNK